MVATRNSRKRQMVGQRLPVTLISGFLGSGKTTLLKNVLSNKQGLRVAVIVNDMAELNIDGALLQNAKLVQKEEKLITMQNGCICCTLREDLLEEVAVLAREGAYDYLMIESTGIGEPMQVAETFSFHVHVENDKSMLEDGGPPKKKFVTNNEHMHEMCGPSLNDFARLDTCVTVVDVVQFFENLESIEEVTDRYEGVEDADERNVSNLLVDQVEFANVILLNKCDLVKKVEVNKVEALIRTLNPTAKVLRTKHSKVGLDLVLNTGLFDMEKAVSMPGWLRSINGEASPETEEYGISSFVYKSRRPFHPERLYKQFLDKFFMLRVTVEEEGDSEEEEEDDEEADVDAEDGQTPEDGEDVHDNNQKKEQLHAYTQSACEASKARLACIGNLQRSKGFFWVATKNDIALGWSHAGSVLAIGSEGPWFATIPKEDWPEDETIRRKIQADFDDDSSIGDRRQELVFIGQDLKIEQITRMLDSCLATPEELQDVENMADPLMGDEDEDIDS